MLKSSVRTNEVSVMEMEEWTQANLQTIVIHIDYYKDYEYDKKVARPQGE